MNHVHSSSTALAFELVNALLAETVFEWTSKRWMRSAGNDVFKLFFCNNSRHREDANRRLLREFADSVNGMRVTSTLQNQLVKKGDEHSEGTPVRLIDFTIGRDGDESIVIVRIVLHEQHGDPLLGVLKKHVDHWSSWQPSFYNAIECVRHPDQRFAGKIILGRCVAR